jgi:hypothetical protein
MDDLERLKQLRAIGVKMVDFHRDGQSKEVTIIAIEFFPRGLLDVSDLVPGDPSELATEPPPAMPEDGPPPKVPPAFANILKKRSVS